jgi:hypothetical protein
MLYLELCSAQLQLEGIKSETPHSQKGRRIQEMRLFPEPSPIYHMKMLEHTTVEKHA